MGLESVLLFPIVNHRVNLHSYYFLTFSIFIFSVEMEQFQTIIAWWYRQKINRMKKKKCSTEWMNNEYIDCSSWHFSVHLFVGTLNEPKTKEYNEKWWNKWKMSYMNARCSAQIVANFSFFVLVHIITYFRLLNHNT